MNAKQLQASAQRIGVEADPRAVRPFRLAAVRLSEEQSDTDAYRSAASEAASLIVGLALADAADDLRRLLTPDPAETNVIWTVACYQIGDLTPSAIRDFADPVDAVATVAACPDEAHVAAELVASTAQGLRWTAILRTNELLSFQLPSADTASDASREHPGDLAAALKRWRDRLADWSAHSGHERDADQVGFAQLGAIDTVESLPARPRPMPAMPAAMPAAAPQITSVAFNERFASLEQRIAGIETSISSLATLLHHALADLQQSVLNKVDASERRVTSTVRDTSSDTLDRVRDLSGRVSTARRGVEDTVRDEVSTVLLGMRAGLSPLTNEVVQRVGEVEREVDARVTTTLAELRHELAVVSNAVASLQRDAATDPTD